MGSRLAVRSLAALALVATGCATGVDGGAADADTASVHAYLGIERSRDEAGTEKVRASAIFLRTRDERDPSAVARLVGALPTLPPAGTCAPLDGDALALRTLSPVELLQATDVSVDAAGAPTRLVARAYPDVAHLVSGVVYTTPDVAKAAPGPSVSFRVVGVPDVPRFDVAVETPEPAKDLRLDGAATGSTLASPDGPLLLSWAPAAAGETVYADVALNGASTTRLRCAAASGSSSINVQLPARPLGSTLSVTVHRVRAVALQADGLTGGEARAASASSAGWTFGTRTLEPEG